MATSSEAGLAGLDRLSRLRLRLLRMAVGLLLALIVGISGNQQDNPAGAHRAARVVPDAPHKPEELAEKTVTPQQRLLRQGMKTRPGPGCGCPLRAWIRQRAGCSAVLFDCPAQKSVQRRQDQV